MTADSRAPTLASARRRNLHREIPAPAAGLLSAGVPVAIATCLVLVSLAAWMEPRAAIRTAALAGAFTAVGIALLRAGRLHAPSRFAAAALALVLAASVMSLGTLGLALTQLPIAPNTVLALGLAAVLPSSMLLRLRRSSAEPQPEPRAEIETAASRPSPAAVAGCALLSAAALFVLPGGVHRLALVVYAGALAAVLWRRSESTEGAASGQRAAARQVERWARLAPLVPLILLALLLGSRLAPFARSPVPLGYDTGLYRAVQAEFTAALPSIPEFASRSWAEVQPPGLYMLTDLLSLGGAPADARLWGLLILTQLIGAIGIWLLAFEVGGRRTANWALVLFVLSSAQFMLFYQVYFKQALSLALLPYALWLWRRESWLVVPVGAFLAATHTMGFLLLGLILLSDSVWLDRIPSQLRDLPRAFARRRYQLGAGATILVLGLASYVVAPRAITDYLSPDIAGSFARFGLGADASAGSFRFDAGYYALLVLPIIPFAALTAVRAWRDPRLRLVVLWAAWAGAFVVLDLLFARRFIASLDPAFIVLAAVSIAHLTAGPLAARVRPFVAIAVLSAAFFLTRTIYDFGPAIAIEDLRDLEATSRTLPEDAYLMAVSGADTPWVRGYGAKDTIAPGLLEHNRWTLDEWATFWWPAEPAERDALLARYGRPIYVFMRADSPLPTIVTDPRFQRISRTLWQYVPSPDGREEVGAPPLRARAGPAP